MKILWLVPTLLLLAVPRATGKPDAEAAYETKGYIVPAHPVQLSPSVGGQVVWLDPNFKEGALYKKGARLAQIDSALYEARLQAARAALQIAEVGSQEVETGSALLEIETAKTLLKDRAARLEASQRDKRAAGGSVTRAEAEKATLQVTLDQTTHDRQKQTVDRLEMALKERRQLARARAQQARAALQEAEINLKNCTITVPASGTILSKKVEVGAYVNPLALGTPAILCEMADLKDLEVEIDVPERDGILVKPGQRCRIMPEAGVGDPAFRKAHPEGYSGVVTRRLPVANRAKGAVTMRIKIDIPENEAPGEFLLPDMGVIVSVLKEQPAAGNDGGSGRDRGSP